MVVINLSGNFLKLHRRHVLDVPSTHTSWHKASSENQRLRMKTTVTGQNQDASGRAIDRWQEWQHFDFRFLMNEHTNCFELYFKRGVHSKKNYTMRLAKANTRVIFDKSNISQDDPGIFPLIGKCTVIARDGNDPSFLLRICKHEIALERHRMIRSTYFRYNPFSKEQPALLLLDKSYQDWRRLPDVQLLPCSPVLLALAAIVTVLGREILRTDEVIEARLQVHRVRQTALCFGHRLVHQVIVFPGCLVPEVQRRGLPVDGEVSRATVGVRPLEAAVVGKANGIAGDEAAAADSGEDKEKDSLTGGADLVWCWQNQKTLMP